MKLDLSADEVLTTTRAVRKRLDFEQPVERAVVEECLEIAFQAPTGSNLQPWDWVVVEDQARRTALAEVYRMRAYPIHATWKPPAYEDSRGSQHVSIKDSAGYQVGMFPVAYTIGTDFKPAPRLDPARITHWNSW